jgi:hypothetical protein
VAIKCQFSLLTAFRLIPSSPQASPLRLEYPGAVYHVDNREDRREEIFRDDPDRELWKGGERKT